MTDIQALRAEHEGALLRIDGVVGVSTGKDEAGSPVLIVYISQPLETVAARLPAHLENLPIRFTFTGEVRAQED